MRILPIVFLLLTLSAFAQDDFDVRCQVPQGWSGGPYVTESNRWAASIKREGSIHSSASMVVRRVNPSDRLAPGWSTMDQAKHEETTFQGYPCKIASSRHGVSPEPWGQYTIEETDFYHVHVSQQLTVEFCLSREAWERGPGDQLLDLGPALRELEHFHQQQLEALESLRFIFPNQGVPTDAPPPAPAPLPETEIPWATVIGAGAGVVLASALALAAKRKSPAAPARVATQAPPVAPPRVVTKEPPGVSAPVAAQAPPIYVLQLSSDHFTLRQNEPARLSVVVWKVDPVSKTYRAASDAVIEMPPPPQLPQLRLTAQPSPGKVVYQLQLAGPCSNSEESLTVFARAGGSLHSARVRLSFVPAYTLEFF